MEKTKDLTKVKARLIELGYIDNKWLDKYLEIIEANLEAVQQRYESQADLRKRNSKIETDAQKLNRTKISNRCHIHKDDVYKHIARKNLNKYLQDGWKVGASGKPRYKTEKIWN